MFFSDKITLRAATTSLDGFGDAVKSYTDTTVWANKKSATRAEFYGANAAGIKVDIVFEVNAEDYKDQTVVQYGLVSYEVMRAYQKGLGPYELVCAAREVV